MAVMFYYLCADIDDGESVRRHVVGCVFGCCCVCGCRCHSRPWREAESSSSRLPAPTAQLQSQWTARAPDYSRLPGRVLVHFLCLCVFRAVDLATTWGMWIPHNECKQSFLEEGTVNYTQNIFVFSFDVKSFRFFFLHFCITTVKFILGLTE